MVGITRRHRFRTLEIGTDKWCKEHITHKGEEPITEDGQQMLENPEEWLDKRTSTGTTTHWYLRKGENRDKLGEWLKKTTWSFSTSRQINGGCSK